MGANRIVWLVDDDPDIRAIASLSLKRAGWQVIQAANAAACLALPATPAPDIIVLDLALPDLPGSALLELLRKKPGLEKTTMIFLTAHADIPLAIRQVADGCLSKPFNPLQLATQLEQILQLRPHH